MIRKEVSVLLTFLVGLLIFSSCEKTYIPKPYGYYRIDLPSKDYHLFTESGCPFTFEYPSYSIVEHYTAQADHPYWYNLDFPELNAKIHLSYMDVSAENLRSLLDESYEMAYKHQIKASSIDEEVLKNSEEQKYGILYRIRGNAASPIQFFLTDSTHHFIRGSLYFQNKPNADSLAPVISFVEKDAIHLIETLKW